MGVSRASWRGFDLVSLIVTICLMAIGVLMVYSAYEVSRPSEYDTSILDNYVVRQALFGVVGLAVYMVVASIDYHVFLRLYRWIYVFVIGLLIFTLIIGQTRFGSQSWVEVLTFTVQPAELAKVLMIIVLARVLDGTEHGMGSIVPLLLSLILVAAPLVLIYLQPDFGMMMMLLLTWVGMVFLAGVRWSHILLLGVAGAAAVPVVWVRAPDYMRRRIVDFVFPGHDPSGSSYNTTQALISIGSGGWWGKGYLQGTQSQLHFLRVRHTDFVFSVLAEEFGFVGSLILLALYVTLLLRQMRIAWRARDMAGRLIVGGAATMVFVQTFVNIGMNAGMLPVTGLTLPLVSYGGSSLTTILFALGLTQSVATHSEREVSFGG